MTLTIVPLAAEAVGEGGKSFWETAYPIIPHPGELIFGLIALAILYWVVRSKVVPRLEEIYAERTAAIEGGIAKAEQAQAEATAALHEYQEQLAQARAEAGRIREEARIAIEETPIRMIVPMLALLVPPFMVLALYPLLARLLALLNAPAGGLGSGW